eukprot:m.61489 g.61489  ORF g.61489 m.61489 type:complete len:625 (+) comp22992_c1_seq1:100-1974(+)
MGQVLTNLFPNPETFPGGNCFSPACETFSDACEYQPGDYYKYLPSNETNWTNHEFAQHIFPDCEENSAYGMIQVLFLTGVYFYILSWASGEISDGSELLLLIPSIEGIVGSVVLPVLGAVPDGAIVLFSGLGSDAVNQIEIGVGAIAGSTIMLITLPVFIAIFFGRVPIVDGKCQYGKTKTEGTSFLSQGVKCNSDVNRDGKIMVLTGLCYLVVQIPSFIEMETLGNATDFKYYKPGSPEYDLSLAHKVARREKPVFLAAFIISFLAFAVYLIYKIRSNNNSTELRVEYYKLKAFAAGSIPLAEAFKSELKKIHKKGEDHPLILDTPRLKSFLKRKFKNYDKDHSNTIDLPELTLLFKDLGSPGGDVNLFLKEIDSDSSGDIDFSEFQTGVTSLLLHSNVSKRGSILDPAAIAAATRSIVNGDPTDEDEDEEEEAEEEEELPEEWKDLPEDKRQWAILKRACFKMFIGTIVVLVVSDPTVDMLSSIGERSGIPAFYIAFILAPLASNASELIAAYNYAKKKTASGIAISLTALEGAGIMNNTFCTAIFFFVIYYYSTTHGAETDIPISWTFTNETLAILLCEIAVGLLMQKSTLTVLDGFIIFSVYPLSLVFIVLMEKFSGIYG